MDWSYLAGLFDGEGCIFAARSKAGLQGSMSMRLTISAAGDEGKAFLDQVQAFIGVGVIQPNGTSSPRSKPGWRWYTHRQAETKYVLEQMMPYLILKRPRALLALEFIEIGGMNNLPKTEVVKARREEIFDEIRRLNKKGIPV